MPFPDQLAIVPLRSPPRATVAVPGSKSITNRALVLAALSSSPGGCRLQGALRSEDTEVMVAALQRLGFAVQASWDEAVLHVRRPAGAGPIPAAEAELFCANSGTTMRFLTAMVSLGQGRYRLDGVPRMRERPIADLLDALRQLGVRAGSERDNGCPPVWIEAQGLPGGTVRIRGDVSSQFLSGLLMAAPLARDDLTLAVEGELVSQPYVAMTVAMVRAFGGRIDPDSPLAPGGRGVGGEGERTRFHIPGRQAYSCTAYAIEPDASAASYFFAAAALTGGEVTVAGLGTQSLQGDVRFVEVLEAMGCRVERRPDRLTVQGGPLRGLDVDMNAISDTVMTLAAVACFAASPTTIRNVAHIRHKETDRLAALATELRRVGAGVDEWPDGLKITPAPLHGAAVQTYNDHRMAMSLALLGLRVPGMVITDPGCVAKTYPEFFADLEKLRQEEIRNPKLEIRNESQ
jgi:3-phosphoshikimate 1-carboxyvinyltransferase